MKMLAEKLLTDQSARRGADTTELAVQLAAAFSPWAQAEEV